MRIGSILRLTREGREYSLRSFAQLLGMPHSTIAAIENGWVGPTETLIDRLFRYLVPESVMYRVLATQLVREWTYRESVGSSTFFPLCLAAGITLRCFLDAVPQEVLNALFEWDESLDPRALLISFERNVSRVFGEDSGFAFDGCMANLEFDLKVNLVRWLLKNGPEFVREKDSHRFPLTRPSKSLQKLLDLVGPAMGRRFFSLANARALLKETPPRFVPDPFLSLDLLLLLASDVTFRPNYPGKGVVILPLPGRSIRIEVYSPPRGIVFPGVDFGQPYVRETEVTDP